MTRALLFDLDDTLIFAYANPGPAWQAVVGEFAEQLAGHDPATVANAITEATATFLSDDDNRRRWRLQAVATRRAAVRDGLRQHGITDLDHLAGPIGDRYAAYREEHMYLYPDALTVIDAYRERGYKLGLVTNGAAEVQRAKVRRFDLARRFDHIQVEEEAGFGKPDGRAYVHTLEALGLPPEAATMVGDDLVWDVLSPQRLGIHAIWYDVFQRGLPSDAPVVPDRVITRLDQLLPP